MYVHVWKKHAYFQSSKFHPKPSSHAFVHFVWVTVTVQSYSWFCSSLGGLLCSPLLKPLFVFLGLSSPSELQNHWKDWCWSWNSNTLATWCEERTHLRRPCCWERLRAGGEGGDRGWDDWMASLTQRTWVWVDCGTGRPGVLQSLGVANSQTRLSN